MMAEKASSNFFLTVEKVPRRSVIISIKDHFLVVYKVWGLYNFFYLTCIWILSSPWLDACEFFWSSVVSETQNIFKTSVTFSSEALV